MTKIKICAFEDNEHVILDVIDNGKGLDPKTQQQVLEPFFTTKAQGTGLGLAVVQSVVRNHGGKIQLSCKPQMGCQVRLSFPMLKVVDAEANAQEINHV